VTYPDSLESNEASISIKERERERGREAERWEGGGGEREVGGREGEDREAAEIC